MSCGTWQRTKWLFEDLAIALSNMEQSGQVWTKMQICNLLGTNKSWMSLKSATSVKASLLYEEACQRIDQSDADLKKIKPFVKKAQQEIDAARQKRGDARRTAIATKQNKKIAKRVEKQLQQEPIRNALDSYYGRFKYVQEQLKDLTAYNQKMGEVSRALKIRVLQLEKDVSDRDATIEMMGDRIAELEAELNNLKICRLEAA